MPKKNIQKIMVPIDGSEPAKAAFEQALEYAHIYQAKLYIFSVAADFLRYDFDDFNLKAHDHELCAYQELLKNYQKEAQEVGITDITIEARPGDLRKEILDFAEEQEIDLIMMGSTGKGVLDRLLIGSVSEYIMIHAACDVFIAK